MDSINMITDMSRKRFRAEPQISATLMPDHARFWPRDAAILDRMLDCAYTVEPLYNAVHYRR